MPRILSAAVSTAAERFGRGTAISKRTRDARSAGGVNICPNTSAGKGKKSGRVSLASKMMGHKGPQKHAPEVIQAAIAKADAGVKLSDIAREFNVTKSTVKYWLDHPGNYPTANNAGTPKAQRICAEGFWLVLGEAAARLRKNMPETWEGNLKILTELAPHIQSIRALDSRSASVQSRVVEVSEEIAVKVKNFLKSRTSKEATETDLGSPPPEQTEKLRAEALPLGSGAINEEANRAT